MLMSPKRITSFCVLKNKLQKFTSDFPSLLVTSSIDMVNVDLKDLDRVNGNELRVCMPPKLEHWKI